MKLLIVDDEAHVRKAIRYFVQVSELNISQILEASGVDEAIALVRAETPELVVTDVVMDEFTGIDLMEYLESNGFTGKVLVVSGYNEYNYIRATMKHGGIDYLLKPIDPEQLISSLSRAMEEWAREHKKRLENAKREKKLDSLNNVYRSQLLFKFLSGLEDGNGLQELAQLIPGFSGIQEAVVGYSSARHLCGKNGQASSVLENFRALGSQLDQLLSCSGAGICFQAPDADSSLYLFIFQDIAQQQRKIEDTLEAWRNMHPSSPLFTVGFSDVCALPQEKDLLRSQAKEAFFSQNILSRIPSALYYKNLSEHPSEPATTEELACYSSLIAGNRIHMQASVQTWINASFSNAVVTLAHLLDFVEQYNKLLPRWRSRLEKHYQLSSLPEAPTLDCCDLFDNAGHFSADLLAAKILSDLWNLAETLREFNHQKENSVIYQVAYYLRLNYDKPFNQADLARLFFINKDYMCRKFKSTFQINMVNYVTQLRIEKAKELLSDPRMRVCDVAFALGFEDEKYFSRQFRRETGCSPNEYRQRLQADTSQSCLK